jgi:hypothetical protein
MLVLRSDGIQRCCSMANEFISGAMGPASVKSQEG